MEEKGFDYDNLIAEMGDQSASVIAEIARRARDLANHTNKGVITQPIGFAALTSMRHHIQLMNGKAEESTVLTQIVLSVENGKVVADQGEPVSVVAVNAE
jgi:hypothetical protein